MEGVFVFFLIPVAVVSNARFAGRTGFLVDRIDDGRSQRKGSERRGGRDDDPRRTRTMRFAKKRRKKRIRPG